MTGFMLIWIAELAVSCQLLCHWRRPLFLRRQLFRRQRNKTNTWMPGYVEKKYHHQGVCLKYVFKLFFSQSGRITILPQKDGQGRKNPSPVFWCLALSISYFGSKVISMQHNFAVFPLLLWSDITSSDKHAGHTGGGIDTHGRRIGGTITETNGS